MQNTKQIIEPETQNIKRFDLGDRTLSFTKKVIGYVNNLPKTISNSEIGRQLIRSSASVGANFIEAEESLSKKDFIFRVKISRKEAKESTYWLKLSEPGPRDSVRKSELIQESIEITKIFGAIVSKSGKKV